MDMVAVGLLPATVVDNWIAEIWVQIIKGLKLDPNAVLRQGADLAGAVRPTNPQLLAMLNKAIAEVGHNATTISVTPAPAEPRALPLRNPRSAYTRHNI
jgi:hypothetical protein